MAADESDEKKPESDPWADILADNLGGDSGGETDDASAFGFLDADDDATAASAEDPFAPAESAAAADPFDFSTQDLSVEDASVEDPEDQEVAAESLAGGDFAPTDAPAEALDEVENLGEAEDLSEALADDLAAELTAELTAELAAELADGGFSGEDRPTGPVADESPYAEEPHALSVFAPEEPAAHEPTPSTIEIGTGLSGLRLDEAEAAAQEALDEAAAAAESAAGAFDFARGFAESDAEDRNAEEGDAEEDAVFAGAVAGEDFSGMEAAAPAAVAVASAAASRAPRKKAGGIGQIVGVVLGGLMAIPIVLGILVGLMWLGWPDTLGLRKSLPSALAFLLPPKPQSALAKLPTVAPEGGDAAGGLAAGGSSLDDVAASAAGLMPGESSGGADAPGSEESSGGESAPVPTDAFAAAATLPLPDSLPGLDPAATPDAETPQAEPAAGAPDATALAAAGTRPSLPGIDDFDTAVLGDRSPAPPVVPEPEPLDTSALDAAVAAADEAFASVAGIDDLDDRVGRRRLIEWYRSLARVAEESTRLERVAADTARPLDGAPEQVVDLLARIAADGQLAEQLGKLGPMWLAFARRDSEGVMLVAEFAGARAVGPWWLSTVAHPGDDGERHELTVVSRAEPAVAAGEPVFITGVIFGDDVVWASDCRSARDPRPTASGAAEDVGDRPEEGGSGNGRPAAEDPFSLPGF